MAHLRIRVLGPLRVELGGVPVPLGGRRQRTALAVLVCAHRGVVSIDRLADALWGDSLPPSAVASARVYVSRLRRLLEPDRAPGDPASVVSGVPPGYALRLTDDVVDAWQFESDLVEAQRLAPTAPAAARDLVLAALDLWRGEAYTEFADQHWALAECARLAELRRAATLLDITLCLGLGRYGAAVVAAVRLTQEQPLREEVWRLLAVALWADGRRGDALSALRRCRRTLAEEVGLDPGQAIVNLERALLADDVSVLAGALGRDQPETGRPTTAVPRQLPSAVPAFAGRWEQLKRLGELADMADAPRPRPVVAVLSGTAGVGKTSLAVHWGHHVSDRFPDGQLYADLNGFDAESRPREPDVLLREFLAALRVPRHQFPPDPADQRTLYRTVLSGRRMLIVLDNARSADQVRPLLPGTPGCVVLVTSRRQLVGLVAGEAAHAIDVDVPTLDEARQLLARRIGADRVQAEPDAADEIIESCGRLPLGLAVVAARIDTRGGVTLHSVAADCRRGPGGADLDLFATADPRTDLRNVFSLSYRSLTPAAARLFRQVALHPGADFAVPVAASLSGVSISTARRLLAELVDACLAAELRPGRYSQHNLLAAYATELGLAVDQEPDRRAAIQRMLDHYLHTAHTAAVRMHPHRVPISLAPTKPGVTVDEDSDPLEWFTDEQAALLRLVARAHQEGFHTYAWQLAWALTDFLDRRGHWEDLLTAQRVALRAADRSRDAHGQGHAHRALARASVRVGLVEAAIDHYQRAIHLFDRVADRSAQGHAHLGRGWALAHQGRLSEAAAEDRQALRVFESLSDRLGQARALNHLGVHHTRLGNHDQALRVCQAALTMFDDLGDQMGQAATHDSLGRALHHLRRLPEAVRHFELSINLLRAIGDRYYESQALDHLGDAHAAAGAADSAREAWQAALLLLDGLNHSDADTVRGKLHLGAGGRRAPASTA
jgi:DNA-binding SARP family transcriptional activator/tetratricopeptide (TPR) repeat protein